jgi:probable rRNA maturation factor
MASKSKVYFFFDKVVVSLENRRLLKKYIEALFKKEKKKLDCLNYVFCSDKRLLQINQDYLKHNYYTDILTFDLSEPDTSVRGEIYISVDRVRENAESLKTSFKNELHRVILHGALHLCGYEDKTREGKRQMRKKEDLNLQSYFK